MGADIARNGFEVLDSWLSLSIAPTEALAFLNVTGEKLLSFSIQTFEYLG
jgi:hypothetical protein